MAIEMMGNYLSPYAQSTSAAPTQAASKTADKSKDKEVETDQWGRDLSNTKGILKSKTYGKSNLEMNDFLRLMAAQLQNQDMNNPASETEMIAQMAQMATITAMTNMTDVSVTTYSASLVGKEVTLAYSDKEHKDASQLIGKVTGAGLYGGEQIIFVGGKSYRLTHIMAIGRLPDADEKAVVVDEKGEVISTPKPKPEEPKEPENPETGDDNTEPTPDTP